MNTNTKLMSTSFAGNLLANLTEAAESDGEQLFVNPEPFIKAYYSHEWRKRVLNGFYYLAKHGYIDYDGLDGTIIITDLETAKRMVYEGGILTPGLSDKLNEALKAEAELDEEEPEEEPSAESETPANGWEQQVQEAIAKCQEAIEQVAKLLAALK